MAPRHDRCSKPSHSVSTAQDMRHWWGDDPGTEAEPVDVPEREPSTADRREGVAVGVGVAAPRDAGPSRIEHLLQPSNPGPPRTDVLIKPQLCAGTQRPPDLRHRSTRVGHRTQHNDTTAASQLVVATAAASASTLTRTGDLAAWARACSQQHIRFSGHHLAHRRWVVGKVQSLPGPQLQYPPVQTGQQGPTVHRWRVGERGRQVLRKAPTAARKLAGQTTPADTATIIITGNW